MRQRASELNTTSSSNPSNQSNDGNIDNDCPQDSIVAGSSCNMAKTSVKPCILSTSTFNFSSQTPLYLFDNTLGNKRLATKFKAFNEKTKKLEKIIKNLNKRMTGVECVDHLLKISKLHLHPNLFAVVKSQINLTKNKKQGYRYNNEIKQLVFLVYFLGPKVYKLFTNSLSLPPFTSLKHLTAKFKLTPGSN